VLLLSAKQIRHSDWLLDWLIPSLHTVLMAHRNGASYCRNCIVELLLTAKQIRHSTWLSDWLIPAFHTVVLAHGSRALYCRMRIRYNWTSAECETNPSLTLNVEPTEETSISHCCNGHNVEHRTVEWKPETVELLLTAKQFCHCVWLVDWLRLALLTVVMGQLSRA